MFTLGLLLGCWNKRNWFWMRRWQQTSTVTALVEKAEVLLKEALVLILPVAVPHDLPTKKIIQDISCIQLIFVTRTTYMCKTEDRASLSSMILIKCQWRTWKVSLTQSQQDLIKPINPYTAAIIQDLWTSTAGKSWWFSNSIYPSLHRDLRL